MSSVVDAIVLEPETSAVCQRTRYRRRHWQMLAICAAVVMLSFVLQVLPADRVAFRGLTEYPLPHVCTSRLWGFSCPGCGLTRSFIHLAHADWRASFAAHRLGWFIALLVLVQFPYRVWALRRLSLGQPVSFIQPWVRPFNYAVLLLLLVNWISVLLQ